MPLLITPPGSHIPSHRGVPDLPLAAHQALGHGGLADQEHLGDLSRGQPAQGAQRQRDPGAWIERRVAAGEDEPEPVVAGRSGGRRRIPLAEQPRGGLLLGGAAGLPADPVHGVVLGDGDQPPGRI
jgi:hypothetical protein